MNILFLTIYQIFDIQDSGIYTDLMRKFRDKGHQVYIVVPIERKYKQSSTLHHSDGITLLNVKTFNLQKTNIIEKGIGILALEHQYLKAIQRYFSDVHFDLIIYSTPPITFTRVIKTIKKRDKASSYLLLKDIFPQNAVDIGMIKEKSILYNFFRRKEKKLYKISDYIGCMSPANVNFVLNHNPEIEKSKVEICPNSIELTIKKDIPDKAKIKEKFNIPNDSVIFIYGGNLGKPQGIDFLLQVLDSNRDRKDCYFLIVGSGIEYGKIANWFTKNQPSNAQIILTLPKQEYDELVQSCDVGLIFLDPRFTIPNYPSRLLSYLEYKMPTLMAVDMNTDIGTIAEENGYGLWCKNGDLHKFNVLVNELIRSPQMRVQMGMKGYKFLTENYTVKHSYEIIMNHFKEIEL